MYVHVHEMTKCVHNLGWSAFGLAKMTRESCRLTHVPFLAVDERLDAPFSFFIHAVKLGLALCAAVVMVTIYHS